MSNSSFVTQEKLKPVKVKISGHNTFWIYGTNSDQVVEALQTLGQTIVGGTCQSKKKSNGKRRGRPNKHNTTTVVQDQQVESSL